MSYAQYESFVATYEKGSYAAAARALYKSPEAISKQVRKLEERLNVGLVETNKNKTTFTSEAQKAYELCANALKAERDLCEFAQRHRHAKPTNITIAVAFQPNRGAFFPKKVRGFFRSCFPNVNLEVREIPNGECVNAVKSGAVDATFTLRGNHENVATVSDVLSFKPLLLVRNTDPLAKHDYITAKDLRERTFAFPVDLGVFYGPYRNYLEKIQNPKIGNPGYTIDRHRDFVEKGGCIFVTPDERLGSIYPNGVFLNLKDFDEELTVSLVTKDLDSPQALLLKDFSAMLKEHLKKN